ncbi:CocE/NonD family hydrolase [Tabrizicola sp.]|uniref:CocE/NonD family hydrolase n=1 Tax=Tabrizicola sp. TaxID=2005166 RepID=UPI002FDC8AAB
MNAPRTVQAIENFWIPMPDGTRLAARMWLPEDAKADPVPAIIEYIPYRKRDFMRLRDESMHPWFAAQGYAAIRIDMRGSGESDGVMPDEYLAQEQQDGVDAIAWIAAQDWCSGKVGIMGKSWGAFTAVQIAALCPPALKAIIPVMGTDNRYLEDIHYSGGTMMMDNLWWGSIMHAFNSRPPDPEIVGDRWREMWLERLEANDYWSVEWTRHPHWDAFWRHGSVAATPDAMDCAIWFWGGWADLYRDTPFRMAAQQKAPLRLTIGPWAHLYPHEGAPGPKVDFCGQALRWWDHWLKGIDNGVTDEPALQIFQTDGSLPAKYVPRRPGHWFTEAQWPTPNVAPRVMRLGPGRLGNRAEAAELVVGPRQKVVWSEGDWVGFGVEGDLPGDQRVDDGDSLTFTGAPLTEALDILGNPELALELEADAPAANISVRLIDVAPDGREYSVSRGLANLAQNADRSATVPLVPGQRFAATVQLHGISHRFLPGHRIKIAVSNGYWPIIWPAAGAASLRLFTESAALTLPVRTPPPGEAPIELPAPPPAAATPPGRTTLQPGRVERDIHVDQMTGEITHRSFCDGGVFGPIGRIKLDAIGLEMHHVTERIFRIRPDVADSARYEMVQSYEMARGDWNIRTEIFDACHCDATHFHISSKVEAFENGKLVDARTWEESIPRP